MSNTLDDRISMEFYVAKVEVYRTMYIIKCRVN